MERLDENLLASPRRGGSDRGGAPAVAPKKGFRFSLKGLGIAVIAIFSFLFFLLLKFPNAVVTNYALSALRDSMPAYNVSAKDSSWSMLLVPHISFSGLEISPRYGSGPKISLDSASLTPNLFRMIPWKGVVEPAASFSIQAFSGEINGSFHQGSGTDLDVNAESLELGKLPILQNKISLDGKLDRFQAALTNDGRWSHANGTLSLAGHALRFDPGSLNLGLPLPMLDLGALNVSAKIQNGKAVIERLALGEVGKDIEAQGFGLVNLKDPVMYSDLDLQIKFRVSSRILKAVPSLEGMLGMIAAKRADGFYGMRVKGPLMMPGLPTPWKE